MSAPTLLVGLGGTGSRIIQKVYRLTTRRQRENIGFVVFDTDANELREIEEKTPQIKTIQTSTRLSVGEYLNVDTYARDVWFPVNRILTSKALTEGAGQVRAASRLALNTAIQQGRIYPLDLAIEDLYKLRDSQDDQAPRVILAGSLCGGTGSGLILPISLYIRNFLTTRMQQSTAIIRGFFLLPEVFDGVIRTQSERNSLRANAYAAVREINAFLMKADGSLPERYDLHFMAPRAGYDDPEEYTGRPMDFCFLFDAQNLNGMKLNSTEQYVDHAANCIYGMAIAPTSKRSNSSEDNVIRSLTEHAGRNRFAGAGSSMLIYPFESVKRYLALNWARESITDEWLSIDRRFADELRENQRRRKAGYGTVELDIAKKYLEIVDEGHAQQRPFEDAVWNLCRQFDAGGFQVEGNNDESYLSALEGYIMEAVDDQKARYASDYMQQIKAAASNDFSPSSEDLVNAFNNWYDALLAFKAASEKCTQGLARNISYSLFRDLKDYTHTNEPYRIEYWLHESLRQDSFVHPNAVRYFLYSVGRRLNEALADLRPRHQEIREFWKTFDEKTFDIKETRDTTESKEQYYQATGMNGADTNPITRFLHRSDLANAIESLSGRFNTFNSKTVEYWVVNTEYEVYLAALDYVDRLCRAFEELYGVLDRKVPRIEREIAELEHKYAFRQGQTCRYVCADETCLRGLASDITNLEGGIDIPAELARDIFTKCKLFALAEDNKKPPVEAYFSSVFDETLIGFFESSIMSARGADVDMDVISAIAREGQYRDPANVVDERSEELYIASVLESARLLSKPFIESSPGVEDRLVPACAYSTALMEADSPARLDFIKTHLVDRGGTADASIDKNMILFYESVYGLEACELSKFAPAKVSETYSKQTGEYYKAYYELVEEIHPQPQKSKVVSPHIDRWWHLINKLPELNPDSQREQEEAINAAFFWGMVGRFISYEKKDSTHFIYRPETTKLDLGTDDGDDWLVVSNSTYCDHLFEVLDAITIYPRLVRMINGEVEKSVCAEVPMRLPVGETMLFKCLRTFYVDEFSRLGCDESERRFDEARLDQLLAPLVASGIEAYDYERVRSIFDLPILMKWSVPVDRYYEGLLVDLLKAIFIEIKRYIARHCDAKTARDAYGELLRSQFVLFAKNMAAGRGGLEDVFEDSLFLRVCRSVAKELEELDMVGDAEAIVSLVDAIRA